MALVACDLQSGPFMGIDDVVQLRILLIDSDEARAQALREKLLESGFAEVLQAHEGANLVEAVESTKPDLVIIDMALPDRDALEDVRAVSAVKPVVMFADSDDIGFVEEAIAAGVCSYNLSGVALQDVKPIMASAIALFRRYRQVETELSAAKTLLGERRAIERAKAILMKHRKMTEPEAYRWLQKKAMDENRKLAQVVAQFVREHDTGSGAAGGEKALMSEIVPLSAARKFAAPKMRIGLLRLTDSAPVIAAHEFGFFAEEGVETELSIEPSWANIADKLAFGFLDAAVIVPPLAFAIQLGLRGGMQPLIIPASISIGGNTVTLNNALALEVRSRAAREGFRRSGLWRKRCGAHNDARRRPRLFDA